jgi:protein SCO1/2
MTRWIFLALVAISAWGTPNPDASLIDQNGKPFQFYSLKGNYVFVSFLFSRCPNEKMCPMTITLTQAVQKQWQKLAPTVPLKFLIVTLDPKGDTPAVLKKYARTHHLDPKLYTLVTGDPKTLDAFATNWNVVAIPGEGIINHNAKSVLLAPDLSDIKMYKDNQWKPEEVIKDLRANSGHSS